MGLLFGVFGVMALATLIVRAAAMRKGRFSLVTALFLGGIAIGVLGPVARSALIGPALDALLGANANWLAADALFAVSLTIATWWADVMATPALRRLPTPAALRWLLLQKRNLALALTLGLMVAGAQDPLWPALKVGSTDLVGAGGVLLLARLAYHALVVWALAYVARAINRYRAHLVSRREYIRYSTPIFGLLVAAYSPAIQVVAEWLAFLFGIELFHRWLPLISGVQVLAYAVIAASALPREWVYAVIDHFLGWEMQREMAALVGIHRRLCPGQPTDEPDALLRDIRQVCVVLGFDPQKPLPVAGRCSSGWKQAQHSMKTVLQGGRLETSPGLPHDQAGLARLCASVGQNL